MVEASKIEVYSQVCNDDAQVRLDCEQTAGDFRYYFQFIGLVKTKVILVIDEFEVHVEQNCH